MRDISRSRVVSSAATALGASLASLGQDLSSRTKGDSSWPAAVKLQPLREEQQDSCPRGWRGSRTNSRPPETPRTIAEDYGIEGFKGGVLSLVIVMPKMCTRKLMKNQVGGWMRGGGS